MFSRFGRDQRGSMMIIGVFGMVALLGSIGLAVDYTMTYQQRAALQEAADAAALASARALGLTSTKDEQIDAIAKQYVKINFEDIQRASKIAPGALNVQSSVSTDASTVTVKLDYIWRPLFIHLISDNALPIRVSSTASLVGNSNVCVITLDTTNADSLRMTGDSSMTANNCGIYANSTDPQAIDIIGAAELVSTAAIFSSGGFTGDGTYLPLPVTDSPPIIDPLADRTPPPVEPCLPAFTDVVVQNIDKTLVPGTYCGGILIANNAFVSLEDGGEYIIKDGPLVVQNNGTLFGRNVGFYFTGTQATFDFANNSTIDLTGREDGAMAGILFFQDRETALGQEFRIESRRAGRLEGAVYLPRGTLIIENNSKVGVDSNWTAIIAHRFSAGKGASSASNRPGPRISINTNFGDSTVPVPAGIAPQSGQPRLVSN